MDVYAFGVLLWEVMGTKTRSSFLRQKFREVNGRAPGKYHDVQAMLDSEELGRSVGKKEEFIYTYKCLCSCA